MLKRSHRWCQYCGAAIVGEADDEQHLANMRAEAALVEHLERAHPYRDGVVTDGA